MITGTKDSQLHRMAVDTTSVGTVQVRKDNSSGIFLKLSVQATDAFIVKLHIVHFLPPDRHRGLKVAKNMASFKTFQHRQGYPSHHGPFIRG